MLLWFIGGGVQNCICNCARCSVIAGGFSNCIGTNDCFSGILGGCNNSIAACCAFIVGNGITASTNNYTYMNNACVSGTTRTVSLVETSARRFKECIFPLKNQIDNIKRLEPIEFTWKKDKTKDIGFIAEDVAKIYPDLIAYETNGDINGIQYTKLTTVLVKAIQQQQQQIDKLNSKIETLSSKLDSLNK